MRAVLQRVSEASVTIHEPDVEGSKTGARISGQIGPGLCVLLGVTHTDTEADAQWMADKIVELRIFQDPAGKLNLSLLDTKGSLLAVSQFTLFGDARSGRRPGFTDAARPELAQPLYARFCALVRARGVPVAEGVFRATMTVRITNEGPVTMLLDSKRLF